MESWPLKKKDENMFWIIEGMLLRIYEPIKESAMWRSRCSHELYKFWYKFINFNEPDIVKMKKLGRLR
jgi:hypothetical protein